MTSHLSGSISVQLQKRSVVSCFIRHEDGTVTCPMGRELFRHRARKHGIMYGSREACRTCPNRCTDSRNTKTVSIGHNTNIMAVHRYGNLAYPLQQLPPGFQPHNSLGRAQKPAQVRVVIRRNPEDVQRRKELVEQPFGTVKWYDGAHYFLCRGKEKVSAEMALTFLTYILCRFLNLLGTGVLVAYFNKRKQEKQGLKGPCFLTFGQFISKMGNKKVRKL